MGQNNRLDVTPIFDYLITTSVINHIYNDVRVLKRYGGMRHELWDCGVLELTPSSLQLKQFLPKHRRLWHNFS